MKKTKLNVYLFFFCYFGILANSVFSCIQPFSQILKYINYFSLGIMFMLSFLNINKTNKKSLLLYFLIISIAITSAYVSKDTIILKLLLLILSCKNIEFDKIVKYDLIVKLIYLAIVLLAYNLNLTSNYYMLRENGIVRSSMGFSHPNTFGAFVTSIIIEWLYIKKKKIKITDLILVALAVYLVDYFSNSRTSEICAIITAILLFIYTNYTYFYEKFILKKLHFIHRNLFLILSICSFLLGYMYSKNINLAIVLDEITTGRIKLISDFFSVYPVNLFGNYIEIIGTHMSQLTNQRSWILDNAYSLLLLRYGLILFLVYIWSANQFFKTVQKEKKYKVEIIFTILLFYGLMETGLYKIEYNIFLLYFSTVIFKKGSAYLK